MKFLKTIGLAAIAASPASATALYEHITGAKLGTGTVLEFYFITRKRLDATHWHKFV